MRSVAEGPCVQSALPDTPLLWLPFTPQGFHIKRRKKAAKHKAHATDWKLQVGILPTGEPIENAPWSPMVAFDTEAGPQTGRVVALKGELTGRELAFELKWDPEGHRSRQDFGVRVSNDKALLDDACNAFMLEFRPGPKLGQMGQFADRGNFLQAMALIAEQVAPRRLRQKDIAERYDVDREQVIKWERRFIGTHDDLLTALAARAELGYLAQ